MVDVMLALRSKTLKGEPLKVRLKSGNIPSPASLLQIYVGDRNLPYDPKNGAKMVVGNHHKKKAGNPQQGSSPREGKKPTRRNVRKNKKDVSSSIGNQILQAPPPPLVESQFPSLEPIARTLDPVVSTKGKEDDDESKPTSSSDGASTATTSTSSSVVGDGPKPKVTGGYAAALLKPAPVIPPSDNAPKETKVSSRKGVLYGCSYASTWRVAGMMTLFSSCSTLIYGCNMYSYCLTPRTFVCSCVVSSHVRQSSDTFFSPFLSADWKRNERWQEV